MTLSKAKLASVTARHAGWLVEMGDLEATATMTAITRIADQVPKLGPSGVGILCERMGIFLAAEQDAFTRKMLALAKSNGIILTDKGWG